MTEDDLKEYEDLINGTQHGKCSLPIASLSDKTPRTLIVGCTARNQMIHIYIHSTDHGRCYFSSHIHGNVAGGFQDVTHIHPTFALSDLRNLKIQKVFTDFCDFTFLKALYVRLGHYKPSIVNFMDWFESSCDSNGYPSQLALYISEDILNAKSSVGRYLATTC